MCPGWWSCCWECRFWSVTSRSLREKSPQAAIRRCRRKTGWTIDRGGVVVKAAHVALLTRQGRLLRLTSRRDRSPTVPARGLHAGFVSRRYAPATTTVASPADPRDLRAAGG